jgi:magnesium transporter
VIRIFHKVDGEILQEKNGENLFSISLANLLWIDLRDSDRVEKESVEQKLGIKLQTTQEATEIESSSRYFETADTIYLNSNFLSGKSRNYANMPVSFVIKDDVLVSIREGDIRSFADTVKKIKINNRLFKTGYQILISVFENKIDSDADFVEEMARDISGISRDLTHNKNLREDVIIKISEYQERTMLLRENINDTQRVISSLLRSDVFPPEALEKLKVMIKDTGSLLHHTAFSFERLEYLQNTFLGLLNIEQNRIIKIFTVVSVIFMPPTLIASLYGMNFKNMPEIGWRMGYPLALALMILSSMVTLLIFRRKKWL